MSRAYGGEGQRMDDERVANRDTLSIPKRELIEQPQSYLGGTRATIFGREGHITSTYIDRNDKIQNGCSSSQVSSLFEAFSPQASRPQVEK